MVGMTAKAKIAVTLPPELVRAAKEAVATGRAESVSAYVARAVQAQVERDDLDSMLDEMLVASGGPLTDAERAAIDEAAGWQ
jgi:Arc/MetJ-type ribon-helix-helix transcriptional regulator